MVRTSKVSQALTDTEQQEIEVDDIEIVSEKAFDVTKYTISGNLEVRTLSIDGTSFDVKIKPLSWSMRNQILSKSLKWDTNGNTAFDGDAYVRECLKDMIVEAPWGRTTESFLISIDHRLGGLLETLVPKAFDEEEGVDIDKVKKEL